MQRLKTRLSHLQPRKFNVTTSRNIKRFFIWIMKCGKISSKLSISMRASFLIASQMRLPKSALRAGMDELRLSPCETPVVAQKIRDCIYSGLERLYLSRELNFAICS